jgi:precorrin-4 C11-methyltransferase
MTPSDQTAADSPSPLGKVYFIGAGPGDPELITLKAQKLIAEAEVIIYAGSLVNPAILAHARPEAARHNSAGMKLAEQIEVMQTAVAKGQTVARLHTGDPAIYGATLEQMRELDKRGIPYAVVPGVTSAFAAAAALGIEFTVPGDTQTVMFTRLAGRTPVPETEALRELAVHHTSMAIFLSAGMVARVVEELYEAGYSPVTPVAVVFRASWPDQLILRGTLADIVEQVERAEITHHALIIVSPALKPAARSETAPDSHLYGTAMDSTDRRSTIAIITLTRQGTHTGQRLHQLLPDSVLYAPARFINQPTNQHSNIIPYTTSVRQSIQSAFQEHSALIGIMASGIVVRDLAPLLRSKQTDPAVVVLDERGQHAISLLSGHKGGANELANRVARLLEGTAVLTTASDVQGLPAIDLLGQKEGWVVSRRKQLTGVSGTLVNGESLGVFQDAGAEDWWPEPAPKNFTRYLSLETLKEAAPAAAVIITHRLVSQDLFEAVPRSVVYHPSCLVVGVGCNRGTPAEEIQAAIDQTLTEAGLDERSIARLATIEDKADEIGLLAVCKRRGWPLKVFTRQEIAAITDVPTPSEWAQRVLGVSGVAEPAAMLAARNDTLLVEKQKFPNVTVAIARILS